MLSQGLAPPAGAARQPTSRAQEDGRDARERAFHSNAAGRDPRRRMTIPTIRKTLQRPSRDPNTNRRGVLGGIGLHSYHAGMRTTTATITLLACSAPLMGQGLFGPQQVISTNADGARSVYACLLYTSDAADD